MMKIICLSLIFSALFLNLVYFLVINRHFQYRNFVCADGQIVELKKVCDGIKNCRDGSDETMKQCHRVICPATSVKCLYGACINKSVRCDGKVDCFDNSDEKNCNNNFTVCGKNEFQCPSGECLTNEKICDGVPHCIDKWDENEYLCEEDNFCPEGTFRCKYGGCIHFDALCNNYRDCIDGSDESENVCKIINCKKDCEKVKKNNTCPPVRSYGVDIKCQSTLGIIPCNQSVPTGTKAHYECKPYFNPVNEQREIDGKMFCQIDGSWSRKPLKCKPKCGSRKSKVIPLIMNGRVSEIGTWPWHASLYILEGGRWTYSCGATLIHEKAVVTAGHCVWKLPKQLVKIALGKYFTDYNVTQDFTIFSDVETIEIQPIYQDFNGNYGSDIAIVVLKKTIPFSDTILPVCIDWDLFYVTEHISDNSLGTAVGMGIKENDRFSAELRQVQLPVVSEKRCIDSQSRDFKKYVTYTTFCAGWINGTSVCNGDSGGGLFFPEKKKEIWFLQGIVSVSPRRRGTSFCDPNYYTIFTKISMYTDWIKSELDKIS